MWENLTEIREIPALLWNPRKEGKQLAEESRESRGHYCKADPELTLFTARLEVKIGF